MTKEKQSVSPDGAYEVLCDPWEPRMSLWVYSPEIVESVSGRILFNFKDPNWSSDYSRWQSSTKVRFGLRKYPGDRQPHGFAVDIDLATNIAIIENEQVLLANLEDTLNRRLKNA